VLFSSWQNRPYIYIYIIYPELCLVHFLFLFKKGSEAALIRHVTEHRGRPAEHSLEGATAEYGGAPGEHARALGEPRGALP